jgi:hypothetical protein
MPTEAEHARRGAAGRRSRPATPEEALERARGHARAAAGEALAALHALLDAATLATSGRPSDGHGLVGPVARVLGGLAADLGAGVGEGAEPLLAALAEALDAEIARWERRAVDDPDARAVLRAFLGVRELLWEFGVRPAARPSGPRPRRRPQAPASQGARAPLEG